MIGIAVTQFRTCYAVITSYSPPLPAARRNLSDFQPQRFLSWLTFHLCHKLVSALYPQAQLERTAHFWEKRWSDMPLHACMQASSVMCPRPIFLPFLCLSYSPGVRSPVLLQRGRPLGKVWLGVYVKANNETSQLSLKYLLF